MKDSLFPKVVSACGLSPIFAESSMRKACKRAGVDPESLGPSDLRKAIPEIRATIESFLHSEARAFVAAVEKLAG